MGGEACAERNPPLALPPVSLQRCSRARRPRRQRAIIRTPAIHIIVPYPAGGIVDIVARAITEQVGRDWKQSIVVEARPGANSNIGTATVARSEGDGYTWLVTGPAVLVNPALYKDAGWDAMKDFKCVGLAVWNQSVALVHPSMPVKTIGEFVELARSKPGQLNFGNPGTGSSIDLSAQKLFQAADIKLTNVGYKGQPQALVDLMTNLMHFEIVSLALALPHIKQGTVKPLAVFTEKRVADLPDVPTIAEAGYAAAAYVPWYGIYVPASTPDRWSGRFTTPSTRRWRIPRCSASSRLPTSRASRCRWMNWRS